MKVIDLLNKIAKGEEVPKYINYTHKIFGKDIMMVCKENIINKLDTGAIELNDEVELIEEEKKIPKKLDEELASSDDMLYKINEIIDYLKSKGE